MSKILSTLFVLLISINEVFAVTISLGGDYGIKNILLFIFLISLFFFWMFIYHMTTPLEFNKKDLLKSITNFIIISTCWIWFIAILYIFQSILFISSSETFLTDKLDLIYKIFILSLILFGVLAIINSIKLYNKMTGTTQTIKEFIYEIRSGGK